MSIGSFFRMGLPAVGYQSRNRWRHPSGDGMNPGRIDAVTGMVLFLSAVFWAQAAHGATGGPHFGIVNYG